MTYSIYLTIRPIRTLYVRLPKYERKLLIRNKIEPYVIVFTIQSTSKTIILKTNTFCSFSDDIFSSKRGGRKSGGGGGYSDRSGGGNYSDGDPEKGKRSLDLTDDEDLGLPKSLQNSPGNKTTIFYNNKNMVVFSGIQKFFY